MGRSFNAIRRSDLLRDTFRVDDLLKHVDHIVELSMDVADNDDWLLDLE